MLNRSLPGTIRPSWRGPNPRDTVVVRRLLNPLSFMFGPRRLDAVTDHRDRVALEHPGRLGHSKLFSSDNPLLDASEVNSAI